MKSYRLEKRQLSADAHFMSRQGGGYIDWQADADGIAGALQSTTAISGFSALYLSPDTRVAATAAISITDHIFTSIAGQVPASFLSDVVNLINRSPSLVAEIQQADSGAGGHSTPVITFVSASGNGGSASPFGNTINIAALSNYNDSQASYAGGSLNGGSPEAITPAGAFVGTLAHEIAHWSDTGLYGVYQSPQNYTIEQASATELVSEGKAADNQFVVMGQIQGSTAPLPAGLTNDNILFNIQGPAADT